MPRYFLGIWRIPMYEYYWGHTAAQIELMFIDQPLTVYKKHNPNEGKKPGDKGYKYDKKKLDETAEKWKQRKAEREKRGFRLDKLLETGKRVPLNTTNTDDESL